MAEAMPPARSATARSRTTASRPANPRRVVRRPAHTRVRWDRVGRVALLAMLGVVAFLYVQHTLAYMSTRSQFERQGAIVRNLERQNAQLESQQRALKDPATIVQLARGLGMVRPGERAYALPSLTGQ